MLIDIEGTDGCGKKTQTELLFKYLTNWDRRYVDEVVNGGSSQKIHITLNGIDYEL